MILPSQNSATRREVKGKSQDRPLCFTNEKFMRHLVGHRTKHNNDDMRDKGRRIHSAIDWLSNISLITVAASNVCGSEPICSSRMYLQLARSPSIESQVLSPLYLNNNNPDWLVCSICIISNVCMIHVATDFLSPASKTSYLGAFLSSPAR